MLGLTQTEDAEMAAGPEPGTRRSRGELLELPRNACLDLLASSHFGRLVVATPDGKPVIRPVNYAFDRPSQSVIFRTAGGSKFHALTHAATAAFEIDGVDELARTGWSVIIQGVPEEVVRRDELVRLDRHGLEPWVPGAELHWMRIRARTVSGRRITLPDGAIPGGFLG